MSEALSVSLCESKASRLCTPCSLLVWCMAATPRVCLGRSVLPGHVACGIGWSAEDMHPSRLGTAEAAGCAGGLHELKAAATPQAGRSVSW